MRESETKVISINGKLPFIDGKNTINIDGASFNVDPRSLHNCLLYCQHCKALKSQGESVLVYNMFSDDIFFRHCPPWENKNTFSVHPMRDDDVFYFRAWMEQNGFKLSRNDAYDLLFTLAHCHTINPAKDYFERLEWDKTPRLDNWLIYYAGAEFQDEKYIQLVGSKWLIGMAARVYNPGCKFDTVLILEGKQGIGKSPLLEELATVGENRYFTDEEIDLNNKDSLMKLQGKLIFEMGELTSFRRTETNAMKAFLSRQVDEYRPPYGRRVVLRPRMFVIAGSINPIGNYLKDPTGNKRYWPVKCGNIDLEALKRDKEQLIAEAVYRYKQKEKYWLFGEELQLGEQEQRTRYAEAAIADDIVKAIDKLTLEKAKKYFSISEVMEEMGITSVDKKTYTLNGDIKEWLISNGFETCRPRLIINGEYKRPERWKKISVELDE